ncbi:MAG: gliding-motility protein MglA [Gemmatimonadetes bacterium]|nr:MAG: gliding-motility protein MglA [Gemmatimonadota bacterium]
MSMINYQKKEVICKIVYYGPGLSGKTTNLKQLAEKVPQSMYNPTGKLIALAINMDTEQSQYSGRTRFFDFLPLEETVGSFQVKFQTYSVPGQMAFAATRRQMLRGVDGIVFVADSQADRLNDNIESFQELQQAMDELQLEAPLILQVNKIDLPHNIPKFTLRNALNPALALKNVFESSAQQGVGVEETYRAICERVLQNVGLKKQGITSRRRIRA